MIDKIERWKRTVIINLQGKFRDFDKFKTALLNYVAEYNSKSPYWGSGLITFVALYSVDLKSHELFSTFASLHKILNNTEISED